MQMYEHGREFLRKRQWFGNFYSDASAALFARFICICVNIPVESLRIRLSNEVKNNKLNYHGFKITLMRDMPYSATFWSVLEWYRNRQTQADYRQSVREGDNFTWRNVTLNLAPGFVLSAILSGITTPFDTLKTRVQSQGIQKYSIFESLKEIHQKEGLGGIFSGVHWRMLRNSCHTSLFMSTYEWCMRYMARERTWH